MTRPIDQRRLRVGIVGMTTLVAMFLTFSLGALAVLGDMVAAAAAAVCLGEADAARRVMAAIEQVTANPELHTRDLGGNATTAEVTQAMCGLLSAGAQRRVA